MKNVQKYINKTNEKHTYLWLEKGDQSCANTTGIFENKLKIKQKEVSR